MRDLIFKNITSPDRTRRTIVSSENYRRSGVHTSIVRHFVCILKRPNEDAKLGSLQPQIYVFRYLDNQKRREELFYRIKGRLLLSHDDELFVVYFSQSSRISVRLEKALK